MPTFDLHFHANIHRLPKRNKLSRLKKIRRNMKKSRVDYVASTEHSYKKPLEAYQRLSDVAQGIETKIIPGVESVSAEGVDIIYLYRSEDHLKRGLKELQTFRWTVRDVASICRDTEAISIIPHPFHIGKSSAGNILSRRAYQQLLKMSDYVEIHNGSALVIDKRLSESRAKQFFKRTQVKLDKTLNLPMKDRGKGLGWAVSSDAHYPGEQYVVGTTRERLSLDKDVFDFLKRRIRFDFQPVGQVADERLKNDVNLLRSFQGVLKEGLIKESLRTLGRARALTAFSLSLGFFQ